MFPAALPRSPVRTWLTLWLCACLLLASPVRGACCMGGVAEAVPPVATADHEDLPPCHRAAAADQGAGGDREAPNPDSGAAGCDHCQCPCRIAAVPLNPSSAGAPAHPDVPPIVVSAGFVRRAPIPPLPPPIA